jgi:hypothetical protein
VLANVPVLTPDVVKAYEMEHCDVCNAFLQKRASAPAQAPVASGVRAETDLQPSVGRALRPLYRILLDVFGPVPWASAQFGYRFVLGLICEATMMRWIFGLTGRPTRCSSNAQLRAHRRPQSLARRSTTRARLRQLRQQRDVRQNPESQRMAERRRNRFFDHS